MKNRINKLVPIIGFYILTLLAIAAVKGFWPAFYFADFYRPYVIWSVVTLVFVGVVLASPTVKGAERVAMISIFLSLVLIALVAQYREDTKIVPPPDRPGDLLGLAAPLTRVELLLS